MNLSSETRIKKNIVYQTCHGLKKMETDTRKTTEKYKVIQIQKGTCINGCNSVGRCVFTSHESDEYLSDNTHKNPKKEKNVQFQMRRGTIKCRKKLFLLRLSCGSTASSPPYIAAPSHHPLNRCCRCIDCRADIQIKYRLAIRPRRSGVIINHVANFFRSRRCLALYIPVVTVERG